MKKIFLLLTVLLTISAQAKSVLVCSTDGDALSDVHLIDNGKKLPTMEVVYPNEELEKFTLSATLKNIVKGEADTFVGTKASSQSFGGALSDAALIRVFPGQKSARLALNGLVYLLKCRKE